MSSSESTSPLKTANDEYTDYSCSTSIERLARDVETLLRSWHVDKGNDRHISMSTASSSNHHTGTNASFSTTPTNSHPPSGASSVTSQMSTSTMDDNTTRTPVSSAYSGHNNTGKSSSSSCSSPLLLLRSNVLSWNVSLTTSSRLVSFTVELQLALWDGPSITTASDDDGDPLLSELPHALRRGLSQNNNNNTNNNNAIMSPFLFENMSSLFGIGQHITLTPLYPRQLSSNTATSPNTNSSATTTTTNDLFCHGDLQFLAHSILQRHDNDKTARWVLYQVLSGWLQTALNCAVANCQCCIPVFGFWGIYNPDNNNQQQQHNYRHRRRRNQHHQNLTNNSQQQQQQRPGELQLVPSWMRDVIHAALPGLPRMSRGQFYDIIANQNKQSIPPLVTGTVLPTVATSGNFWCSVIPGHPSTPSRLTLWGSILLQHCPQDDTVVMWGAKHVFGWWKQPLEKASAFQMLFHPDNYHFENENNPYTAWRRRPKPNNNHCKKPKITMGPGGAGGIPRHVIDLTGDDDDDDDDQVLDMQTFYVRMGKYQDECLTLAMALLDQAAGASASEPRWGPVDDPVASIHATLTWNGSPNNNNNNAATATTAPNNNNANKKNAHAENPPSSNNSNCGTNDSIPRQPLLSFPLRIRSKQTMSAEDWIEMEESVERTILDPFQPCKFQLQTWWDLETPVASLAATQQCILAALIRTSTLPDETLLKHITDDAVVDQWDNESGNVVAACLAQQAQVGPTTRSLVHAMDWVTSSEEKMELRDAQILVRHILQPDNGSNFPVPPTSPLEDSLKNAGGGDNSDKKPAAGGTPLTRKKSLVGASSSMPSSSIDGGPRDSSSGNTFAPLFKSAPLGRLVSILCVHMARLRSPCSMAMLWMAFCHEVRMRWEHRLALPHMNHVPGLDPSPAEMKERNRCFNTLGVKAEGAAYWHGPSSSESSNADGENEMEFPNDHHCLIGQKLQVVNLCIDLVTAVEARRVQRQQEQLEQSDKRRKRGDGGFDGEFSPSQREADLKKKIEQANRDLANGIVKGNGGFEDPSEEYADALSGDEFFDSEDAAAIAVAAQRSVDEYQKAHQRQVRKGVRCPVPGCNLVANGDPLYAPYLQRPYPLTDDVIAERHLMLSRHYDSSRTSQHGVLRRLEISYRLQKPKLLSDMCAFKAANPAAVFQDFINWFGNPSNPLDDYSDTRNSKQGGAATIGDLLLGRASTESVAVKLDKAAEAIQMLNETREFWSRTWEEASPIPASDQKLLFDVTSTVEMALDFMENMHPAILINQCLAVNLAVSYFTLVGAAKEAGVNRIGGLVQRAFERLRDSTERALELLSGDATRSTSSAYTGSRRHEGSSSFVTLSVISACDAACSALSDAEVLTARATSLLHKFPEQYELVESILRHEPGHEIDLSDAKGRSHILQAIHKQQQQKLSSKKSFLPKQDNDAIFSVRPALREYLLRNLDDSRPCQLSVRFADELVMFNRSNTDQGIDGGMIIALTKSFTE